MSLVSEILGLSALNLRTLPQRFGNALVIVTGIAGVVAVLTSMLALSIGFRHTVASSGRDDRAVVLAHGMQWEGGSQLPRASIPNIMNAAGVRRTGDGLPLASAELVLLAPLTRRSGGTDAFVALRGIGNRGFALRREFKLVEGRMFKPAVQEVIVGRSAQKQFSGAQVGDSVDLVNGSWKIVGAFTSDGSSFESSFLTDAETLLSVYKANAFNSVTVQLDSASALSAFRNALRSDPTLAVDAQRESSYFAEVSQPLNRMLNLVIYLVGAIMTMGAIFGALNTMYTAVSTRAREIATLRALGFGGGAVVVSVLFEALLLALLGAGLGVLIVWLAVDGRTVSTIGDLVGNNPQLVYSLKLTSGLVSVAVLLAGGIGFFGGLTPAIRAASIPVAEALRAE